MWPASPLDGHLVPHEHISKALILEPFTLSWSFLFETWNFNSTTNTQPKTVYQMFIKHKRLWILFPCCCFVHTCSYGNLIGAHGCSCCCWHMILCAHIPHTLRKTTGSSQGQEAIHMRTFVNSTLPSSPPLYSLWLQASISLMYLTHFEIILINSLTCLSSGSPAPEWKDHKDRDFLCLVWHLSPACDTGSSAQ